MTNDQFPLLQVQNLTVDFVSGSDVTNAVKNISFSVKRNEVVGIVGESGSGKSVTALSILKLLAQPPAKYSSGQILFSEDSRSPVDLLSLSGKQIQAIRGNKIGMIFQEPMSSLNPVFTCGSQVTEALLEHKNISTREAKNQAMDWFSKVNLPAKNIFNRYPHQLSGGQKQRVMIAMAMCCQPSILICDEPTTALDVTVQKTILQLIKELQRDHNMGVIFISHDLGIIAEIADRAVVMFRGEIVEENSVQEIFLRPQNAYTKSLLACRPIFHSKGERLPTVSDFMENESPPPLNLQTTKPASPQLAGTGPASSDPLIKVVDLIVRFPSKKNFFGGAVEYFNAVDGVSFEVYKGETLGLVGESGCGKTTLGRTLLRLIEPSQGKIFYNQTDLSSISHEKLKNLRKNIQIVFQDPYSSLNPRLTVGSAIKEPMSVHNILGSDRERKEKSLALLEKVNLLPKYFNRYPHEFSGGQRQRIVIARALSLDPSFIVFDEPVSALDVSVQAQVLNLLNDLKKEFGFTAIFISHDLSVVRYISDRIMVMNKGRIEEIGNADSVYFNPGSEYTKKLVSSIPRGRLNDFEED